MFLIVVKYVARNDLQSKKTSKKNQKDGRNL